MSGAAKPSAPVSRERAFAQAALNARLVSREHAEECLKVAHDLAKRGKPVAIEEVFVRKGYLRRPEAQKLARGLPVAQPKQGAGEPEPKAKAPHATADKLDLAPERSGRRCPSCDKDPGRAEDYCPRCGADLETGGPGPDATICTSCGRVVKNGSAVCPRCALPIDRKKMGRRGTGSGWLDRLIVLGALAGCFYFLVYRHVIAPSAATSETVEGEKSATERVKDALAKNDLDAAAQALEAAIKEDGHDPALEPAYALACLRAGKIDAARAAILDARKRDPESVDLLLVSAEIAAGAGEIAAARSDLALVGAKDKDDRFQRTRARVAQLANDKDDEIGALAALKQAAPPEQRHLAELLVSRAQRAIDAGDFEPARKDLEASVLQARDWSVPHEKLGVVCLKRGETQQAVVQFQRAIDLDPNDLAPKLGLAIALDKKQDAKALDAYRAYLRAAKPEEQKDEISAVRARIAVLEKR